MPPSRCRAAALLMFVMSLGGPARAAEEYAAIPVQKQVDTALHSILLIAGVLLVLILIAVAIIVYRKVLSAAPDSLQETASDPLMEAAAEERRGNFGAAASRYEAGGEKIKAAECWEKIKDFARAAECWEAGGDLERAAQLHVRSGSALRAAGIYMKTNNYIEAAKIFRNKGDHLRAAQALELYGNKLAAAREYAAAGNHALAARLFEQEKLSAEAADAAAAARATATAPTTATPAPRTAEPAPVTPQTAGTGPQQPERAVPARSTTRPPAVDDFASEIELDPADEVSDPLKRVFTLRSMIHAGRMEPRYSMRLWVQVMRALAERHLAGEILGFLTPDSIIIDMQNNVRIEKAAGDVSAYLSPEAKAGRAPDRQTDIYSMGVILYELVSGSVDQFGNKRAGELFPDVPSWLDDLIARCTEKDLAARFRTAEEVSAALLKLKTSTQE